MQKALFISVFLLMFVWGGFVFGADTCPDVTGIWDGTTEWVSSSGGNPPLFSTFSTVLSIDVQNGCSFAGVLPTLFDMPVVGTLRKISATQYAVTMQHRFLLMWGTRIIEGTLTCTTSSDRRLELPPGCSTMSTSFHGYNFDPNGATQEISVGTIKFSKQ